MSQFTDLVLSKASVKGFWMLDDTVASAPTVNDLSPGGHDGTDFLTREPLREQASILGTGEGDSMTFSSDAITVEDHADLRLTTQGTIIAWVDIAVSGNINTICGKFDGATFQDGFYFAVVNGEVRIATAAGGVIQSSDDGIDHGTNPMMVGVAWNGVNMKWFHAGAPTGTRGDFQVPGTNTGRLAIGSDSDPLVIVNTFMNGGIQALAYFNTRLTDEEIAQITAYGDNDLISGAISGSASADATVAGEMLDPEIGAIDGSASADATVTASVGSVAAIVGSASADATVVAGGAVPAAIVGSSESAGTLSGTRFDLEHLQVLDRAIQEVYFKPERVEEVSL